MRRHHRINLTFPLHVTLAIVLAACASAAMAQDRGRCITANVPEAFTLPDGSLHAAGRITLCTHLVLNPVTGLHRIWADGDGASLAMSRRFQPKEFKDSRSSLLFRRAPSGTLDLVGYVVPFNHKTWSYALQHTGANGAAEQSPLAATQAKGELVTLLATQSSNVR